MLDDLKTVLYVLYGREETKQAKPPNSVACRRIQVTAITQSPFATAVVDQPAPGPTC